MDIGKIANLLNLFRKGEELANAEVWKDRANLATVIVPAVMAVVKVAGDYGYGIQLTTEEATNITLGIVAVVQFVIHNVTSKRAGVLPAKAEDTAA